VASRKHERARASGDLPRLDRRRATELTSDLH
jgi:hypothetical protein